MGKSHLVLLFVWICIQAGRCSPTTACQTILQEGETYTMHCSFPISEDTKQFHWTMSSSATGIPDDLFTCDFSKNKNHCGARPINQVSVTYSSHSTQFTGFLKIFNITSANRNKTVQCKVQSANGNELVTLKSCNIDTFAAPEAPTCQAEKLDTNETLISCQTPKVYPDIFCKLYQAKEGEFEKVFADVMYNRTSNRSNSATCSFILQNTTNGLGFYKVKMYASVHGNAIPRSEKTIIVNTWSKTSSIPINLKAKEPALGKSLLDNKKSNDKDGGVNPLLLFTAIGAGVFFVVALGFFICMRYRASMNRQEDQLYSVVTYDEV